MFLMKLEQIKHVLLCLLMAVCVLPLHAEDKPWSHESEAAVVKVGGNTRTDSYSAKQKTAYKFDANVVAATARYLLTESSGVETAKSWEAYLRYERELSSVWSVFAQHGAESDPFAGYVQRDNTDLGGKYFMIKTDTQAFFTEAGIRYVKTNSIKNNKTDTNTGGRLFVEYSAKITDTVSGRAWVEYIHNFDDRLDWLLNYEPSMSVMLSQIFSLKVSYLVKHHDKARAIGEKRDDTTFMTSLVAKF